MLIAPQVAMVANILLKIACNVPQAMSELVLSVKGDVSAINSMITHNKDVLLVVQAVLLALHSTTVLLVKILQSLLEEVSALTALIHATLVMLLELALAVSVDSISSKAHAKPLVPLELFPSTEPANAHQESFLTVNV